MGDNSHITVTHAYGMPVMEFPIGVILKDTFNYPGICWIDKVRGIRNPAPY